MNRWHHSFPARQLRARPLACFTLMFILGLIIAGRCAIPIAACAACCAAALVAAVARALNRRRCVAAMMLLGFALGLLRMTAAIQAVPVVQTQYSVHMVGHVVSEPYTNPDTGRVISRFRIDRANDEPSGLYVRLYLRGDPEALERIAYGQRLDLTGHIWENDPVTNPHEFDFGAYLRRDGMSAIATSKIEDVTIVDTRRDVRSLLIDVRAAIAGKIDSMFPHNASMVRALVLGDRSLVSTEMRESLNATGTAHLIAISGLHVTVLAFALSMLLGLFLPGRIANLAALLPLALYGALIGYSPSFVRAVIMFAVLSASPVFGLPSDPVTRLCVALLACLSIAPLKIADAGLVLSFAASGGILLLMPPLQALLGVGPLHHRRRGESRRARRRRRALVYFADLVCASIAAQLMSLPAVIAWFGVQSVISLPVNVLCVPLCMAGYVLSLAALAVGSLIAPLGALIARAPDLLFDALIAVTRGSAGLPVTVVHVGRYSAPLVLLHGAIALAASDLSRIRLSIRRFLPLSLIAVAGLSTLLVWSTAWPFSVTFLNAGQADCAVLRTRGRTYVFDAGDTYTPAADYLSATCIHLNGVILSHPHEDHAGGLADILAAFRPDAVYVPAGWFDPEDTTAAVSAGIQLAIDMGIPVRELAAGDSLALSPDCEMTVWSPAAGSRPAEVNDMSLMTLVSRGRHSVMFTGDLTQDGEPAAVPDCDILKVAHHGADNATSARFLEAATPQIAVISVGENNFGHPGDEALDRLALSGARILRTDELGAITLRADGDGWRLNTYLEASDDLE